MPKRFIAITASTITILVFILFAISVGSVGAQECPSPQLIDTITGNGSQQTAPFTTSTNLLRLSYNVQATTETVPVIMQVRDANDPENRIAGTASTEGPNNGERFINASPGHYFLDIKTTDAQYTIKIEGCGSSAQASPGEGTNVKGTTQPKTSTPPKTTPQPKASPTPQPVPPVQPQGALMSAGGPERGPVPQMPGGGCPLEYPVAQGNTCYR